ncbi:ABC transporter permease [Jiella sp. M17.18]|uniref:ABC transporter permease n=1 Tax=Jiella sp. M17.18 TaxID=3234247 RepID=UPI0034DF8A67
MTADASLAKPERPPARPLVSPFRAFLRVRSFAWGLASIIGGLLLWEFASRVLVANSLFLSSPSQIVVAIADLIERGQLLRDVMVSGSEFLFGYVLAAVAGVLIGILLANSKIAKQVLQPWISGLYATPTIALAPLFILWLGVGISSKVVMVVTLVIFPVIINTEAGLRTTPLELIEMIRCFGASRRQVFLQVALPSALPFIFAGLKLGIGRGLIGVVVAELFGSRAGLGQLISQAADAFNMPQLFAGVVILAAAGVGLTAAFGWLESRLLHWKD